MDLKVIIDGWPYDPDEEANNIRMVVGLDRELKLQIRLQNGVVQWEAEGRPDGQRPYGQESMLDYCRHLLGQHARAAPDRGGEGLCLTRGLLDELEVELIDYARRRQAFFLIGDYRRTLNDALHALGILDMVCPRAQDPEAAFRFARQRPQIIADRARAEALLAIQADRPPSALDALNRGIEEIEAFFHRQELDDQVAMSRERSLLVDFRRSLRERYNPALSDAELLHALKAEQQVAVERENYEMAARLRDRIVTLRQRMVRGQ